MINFMEPESKQPFDPAQARRILECRKEIEQELVDMLKETKSAFSLQDVRDAIFHEEDNDDMMKVVAMLDPSSRTQGVHYGAGCGGDASELSNIQN